MYVYICTIFDGQIFLLCPFSSCLGSFLDLSQAPFFRHPYFFEPFLVLSRAGFFFLDPFPRYCILYVPQYCLRAVSRPCGPDCGRTATGKATKSALRPISVFCQNPAWKAEFWPRSSIAQQRGFIYIYICVYVGCVYVAARTPAARKVRAPQSIYRVLRGLRGPAIPQGRVGRTYRLDSLRPQ